MPKTFNVKTFMPKTPSLLHIRRPKTQTIKVNWNLVRTSQKGYIIAINTKNNKTNMHPVQELCATFEYPISTPLLTIKTKFKSI